MKALHLLIAAVLLGSAPPAEAGDATTPLPKLTFSAQACIRDTRTVTVSPGQSIQDAAVRAGPGTVILVRRGTYEGNLDLSGVHGEPGRPILLVSADGPGAARIVGTPDGAAIGAWGISHVGVYGFEIVSDTRKGDIGGIKIAGPWRRPALDVVFAGNTITGEGTDGAKFFNGAKNIVFAGNVIDGNWREEAIDLVSVEDSIFSYNTVRGVARNTGITAKAGSRNIVIMGNDFGSISAAGIFIGGIGSSRLYRSFPDYWKGFEARNILVRHNVVANAARSVVFVGSNDSTLEENYLSSAIRSRSAAQPGHFIYHSFNNRILNNVVPGKDFFQPDDAENSADYAVSGNATTGSRPAAGAANLPGPFMNICPGGNG